LKACANIKAEVFVLDNNSTDGSQAFFANRFPSVQFIWKKENGGFAKANNEALKLAKGEKILFLNPDTILPEDCFEKCLQFFKQQNNVGALGVKMIDGAGNFLPESKRGFPSAFTSFCKMTGLTSLFPTSKLFANYYLGHLPENETNEADVISGAFMMIDKKVLENVGGFDEDYFMYAEDIDLSYRIQKAGYKNFYFADTSIIHFKGESTAKQSVEYLNNFYGTMVLFIKKHYPKFSGGLYVLLLKILIAVKKLFASKIKPTEGKTLPAKAYVIEKGEMDKALLQQHFSLIEQTEKISTAEKGSAVIFCEPYISFAEMITAMQQHKKQYSFLIHAAGTQSIIGSGDKNKPGIAIAFHQ
jgi:N-acetylglucosaminyl-diphospho-decaprenol L-rhamnosyltransferase